MTIGVDSCVLIAGVHANHPLHAVAAKRLVRHIQADDAFILNILAAAGATALATFNTAHFDRLKPPFKRVDPSLPADI